MRGAASQVSLGVSLVLFLGAGVHVYPFLDVSVPACELWPWGLAGQNQEASVQRLSLCRQFMAVTMSLGGGFRVWIWEEMGL